MSISAATDKVIGAGAAVVGTAGLSFQLLQDALSIVALSLNIALAIGGLWLLAKRHKNVDMEIEQREYERDKRSPPGTD